MLGRSCCSSYNSGSNSDKDGARDGEKPAFSELLLLFFFRLKRTNGILELRELDQT